MKTNLNQMTFRAASGTRGQTADRPRRSAKLANRRRTLAFTVAAAASILAAGSVCGEDYYSNDLTPAGSASGRFNGTSGGRQVGAAQMTYGYPHAVILNGNALTAIDLNPASCIYSMAMCSDDSQQGGWGYTSFGGIHALVWNGSADSCTDLNPSGYNFSYCLGVHGGEQAGYAQSQSYFITASHAMSWHGSAASAVDLHPNNAAYPFSRAVACYNGEEAGYISSVAYPDGDSSGYHTTSRAMKWNGSAASAVDLHPAGYDASEATCTSGTQQGGWGYIAAGTTHQHALLWSGDASSVIDLHPAGYTDSKVTSISGSRQAGEGWIGTANAPGSIRHALVWSSSAESVIDLNQYLPPGYTNAVATGVDADGNIVGYAYNGYASGLTIPAGAVAVVFAPGAAPATGLASLTLAPSVIAPGDSVEIAISLGAAAPAGGVNVDFLSTATNVIATPASVQIPEGETNAVFTIVTDGSTLTVPSAMKLYVTDGRVSRAASLSIYPVVKAAAVSANPVEGGFATYGALSLNIPAQFGGAAVSLTSGNPALASVPATVTVPQGYTAVNFSVATAPVDVMTAVPITATINGTTATGSLTLSPAPVIALSGITAQEMVGGQPIQVTVTLNNFPRSASGAVITLESADTSVIQVPETITIPQGGFSATVTASTAVVEGRKGVSLKASYNGGYLSTTVFIDPIPTVTILQADYLTDTKMLKIAATTTFTNAVLTYGGSPDAAPLGTMQFEQGMFKGSIILDTPPAQATVWNSLGGMATVAVNVKTSSVSGGGGGGSGGGGSKSATCKLAIATVGKGTVTTSPSGSSFAAGTTVTLTATPDAGSPWIGWSGDASGTARTISITMNKNMKVYANFK